jgi:hypothetical protein
VSRSSVISCDRCGSPVRSFSIIEATAGPLRSRLWNPVDLCEPCCSGLVDYIRGGRQAPQDGLGGPLMETAVASMRLASGAV